MRLTPEIIDVLESAHAQLGYLAELVEGNDRADNIRTAITQILKQHRADSARVVEDWPSQPLAWDADVAAPGQGHGWIQWKGTSVCMDVHCACGAHGHVDAEFAYFYRCLACGRTFSVGQSVRMYECSPEAAAKYGERAVVDRDLETGPDKETT